MGDRDKKLERGEDFLRWCREHCYLPVDREYETARSSRYVCTCGAERAISWTRLSRGKTGCKPCSAVRAASGRKYTIEQAGASFTAKKLRLPADTYKDANTPLPYVRLVCGVAGNMRLGSLNLGHGCKTCAERMKAAARRISCRSPRVFTEAGGLELLDDDYRNNATPTRYRCLTCGHLGTTFKVVRRGGGCSRCAVLNRTGPGHHRWIEDREEAMLRKKVLEKCHDALKHCFLYMDGPKSCRTYEAVGYSPRQLREHLGAVPGVAGLAQGRVAPGSTSSR